jgi:hypothetical protein
MIKHFNATVLPKLLLSFLLLLNIYPVFSNGLVAEKILQINKQEFQNYNPFQIAHQETDLHNVVSDYLLLKPGNDFQKIMDNKPDYIRISLPFSGNTLNVLLYKVNISPNGFNLMVSSGKKPRKQEIIHYRGMIENDNSSVVSFSFSYEETMGLISNASGNITLGKLPKNTDNIYIIYNDRNILKPFSFECATDNTVPKNHVQEYDPSAARVTTLKCVNWYWETDYDIFQDKDSISGVNSYMQGIFNQVSTLYANDGVSITLLTLYIWDTVDPYIGPTTSDYLTQFGVNRTSFNGDLAHLIGYNGNGGIAWINGVCNSPVKYRMGYSGINSAAGAIAVPTYSWTVEVVTHEEGHLLGSRHTHDCAWNGNNTPIDGCGPAAGYTVSCTAGPIPVHGTIMSYCHLLGNVGIDFNLGFGPQPTTVIVNTVNNAACLQTCGSGCTLPAQPASIAGSAAVCSGSISAYSVTAVSGATSYIWTLPTGWTGSSTTNSINATAGSSGGTITVVAVNSCGNSVARTTSVSVSSVLSQPGSISVSGGSAKVCPGDSRIYATAAATGVTFNWSPPAGATISSGQGTNSVTVLYTANFISNGTLSVVKNNSCGNSTARTLAISRNTPSTPGTMSGIFSGLCSLSNMSYSVPAVAGMTYTWAVPSGAIIASGQTTHSITVNWPAASFTGSITVKANNACGSSALRSMTVRGVPATPSVINGSATLCPNSTGNAFNISPVYSATTYTWTGPAGSAISDGVITSANNVLITASNAVTLNVASLTSTSKLLVRANNSCGTSGSRGVTLIQAACRISDNAENTISVFPNPAKNELTVSNNCNTMYDIQLLDITGKIIYSATSLSRDAKIYVSSFHRGIYILKVICNDNITARKVELQ